MAVNRDSIEQAIAQVADPYLGVDWYQARCVRDIVIVKKHLVIRVVLGYILPTVHPLKAQVLAAIQASAPGYTVDLQVTSHIIAHAVQHGQKGLGHIKNIIAVASGKGGVGKSTVSANLAAALAQDGAAVGVLDADIYGPSQPMMLGAQAKVTTVDKKMQPLQACGVSVLSMGHLTSDATPVVWRGPMVSRALVQLLTETAWPALDYLIVDLPPGTGDIQLTLAQKMPVSAAVIVTTPQDVALIDARKAYEMFGKVGIAVLGVVENMSTHVCSACGHKDAIFGDGGAERMGCELALPVLATLPLHRAIREHADAGTPEVCVQGSDLAASYRDMARSTAARLAQLPRDYSALFPDVVLAGEGEKTMKMNNKESQHEH